MKPTVKTDKYELWHGDCLEIMPLLAARSVDAVIADPPYQTTASEWDIIIPFDLMWKGIESVIKETAAIILFGARPFSAALLMSNLDGYRYDFSWDKKHPKGHLNAKIMPMRRHEDILVFGSHQATYNPQMRTGKYRNKGNANPDSHKGCYGEYGAVTNFNDQYYPTSVLEFNNANQSAKLHPNEKPVPLLEYLIKTYTNETETVLDFTFGSGSCGVAAIKNNRYFVGIESDEKYFAIAAKRLADCASQGMLEFTQ